jgi:hypothetical protein
MELWHCGQTNAICVGVAGLDNFGSDDSPAIALLSALFAHAVDLKGVAGCQVVVLASDFPFQFPDLGRKEFNGGATFGAYHVVMAAPVVLMFVARDAVMKGDFAGQAAIGQELQGSVDGRESDVRVLLLYQPMQFVGREVLAGFQKRAQDGAALFRLFEPHAFEVPQKDTFSFANVLPRNRWLIVDAFLQHGVRRKQSGETRRPFQAAFMILGEQRLSQLEETLGSVSIPIQDTKYFALDDQSLKGSSFRRAFGIANAMP